VIDAPQLALQPDVQWPVAPAWSLGRQDAKALASRVLVSSYLAPVAQPCLPALARSLTDPMLSADLGHCLHHFCPRKEADDQLLATVARAHGLLDFPAAIILSRGSHIP
jgi:hypothetical protein